MPFFIIKRVGGGWVVTKSGRKRKGRFQISFVWVDDLNKYYLLIGFYYFG